MIADQHGAPLAEERDRLAHGHRPGVRQALGPPEQPALHLGGGGRRHEPAAHERLKTIAGATIAPETAARRSASRHRPAPSAWSPTRRPASGRASVASPSPAAPSPGRSAAMAHAPAATQRAASGTSMPERAPHTRRAEHDDGKPSAPGEARRQAGRRREPARDEPRGRPAGQAERLGGGQARHADHEEARERHAPERRRRRRDRLAPVDPEPAARREVPREPEVDPAVVERQARGARDPALRDEEEGDGQRAAGEKQDVPPVEARGGRPRAHAV